MYESVYLCEGVVQYGLYLIIREEQEGHSHATQTLVMFRMKF